MVVTGLDRLRQQGLHLEASLAVGLDFCEQDRVGVELDAEVRDVAGEAASGDDDPLARGEVTGDRDGAAHLGGVLTDRDLVGGARCLGTARLVHRADRGAVDAVADVGEGVGRGGAGNGGPGSALQGDPVLDEPGAIARGRLPRHGHVRAGDGDRGRSKQGGDLLGLLLRGLLDRRGR